MGAWNYKVLTNDYACDFLHDIISEDSVSRFVKRLFKQTDDEFALLLGVAIVDASLHGVDPDVLGGYGDYPKLGEGFFRGLIDIPLDYLKPAAIKAIDRCIEMGVDDWAEDCRGPRMKLYQTLKDRLSR